MLELEDDLPLILADMSVIIFGQYMTVAEFGKRAAVMRPGFSISKRLHKRSWSLRRWLIAVAAISTAGALLTGALAGWYSWHQQKARLDQSMVATTRAIIQATEYELDQVVALARGLAIAPSLQSGDINSFERRSRALIQPFGYFFVLTDADSSKELFNTGVPAGTGYPALPPEWMRNLGKSQMPIVRPIVQRPADGMWTTLVQMTTSFPQGRNYVITLGVPYERFQRIIDQQQLPPEWFPAVIDQDRKIVARRLNQENFIGANAPNPDLMKQPGPDITYQGRELEGYETVNARSRSEKFGWTAAVAVPRSLLLKEFLAPAALAALTGFFVCLAALGTIWLLVSRLIRDVRVLSKAAEQLSERQVVEAGPMHITELKEVASEIQHASERLKADDEFRKHAELALRESVVAEKENGERMEVMVAELQHRTRNLIAVVRSIANQTMAITGPTEAFREEFNRRLEALGRVQGLLSRADQEPIMIRSLVGMELDALGAKNLPDRIQLVGPDVPIRHSVVQTFALALHELATNARKYGALSTDNGDLKVTWRTYPGQKTQRLHLEWLETGGNGRGRQANGAGGYGRELIERALPYSLNAKTSYELDESGLRCSIDMPLDRSENRRSSS